MTSDGHHGPTTRPLPRDRRHNEDQWGTWVPKYEMNLRSCANLFFTTSFGVWGAKEMDTPPKTRHLNVKTFMWAAHMCKVKDPKKGQKVILKQPTVWLVNTRNESTRSFMNAKIVSSWNAMSLLLGLPCPLEPLLLLEETFLVWRDGSGAVAETDMEKWVDSAAKVHDRFLPRDMKLNKSDRFYLKLVICCICFISY